MKNHAKQLHTQRMRELYQLAPDISADPDLASAWRSLQLHWLATENGYRDLIKQKVSEAKKRERLRDERMFRAEWREDVDLLGREIEGCG